MIDNILTLLMLIALQAVLSIDNLLYISLASKKIAPDKQKGVIRKGIIIAIGARIALLFILTLAVKYFQEPFIAFSAEYFNVQVSWHVLIVLVGGAFVMYTSIREIWHMLSPEMDEETNIKVSMKKIIWNIVIMNVLFSFDSILSAMALTEVFWVMAVAIVISGLIMMILADKVSEFLNKNRIFEIGGLFVLMLVGMMLITEAAHLAHLEIFKYAIEEMSKANFYFILSILVIVFIVNNKFNKKIINNK